MTSVIRHLALGVAALVAIGGCGDDASARSNQSPDRASLEPRVDEISDSSRVTVPHPEQFPLVTVATRAAVDRLSGTCVVAADVDRTIPVNALGGGRVVDLDVKLGDAVRKGQKLVTISSPDLTSALADHHKAVADEALARVQLERSRVLFEHGSIARKDLEAAEDTEQKAQVDLRATDERVHLLGGTPAQTTPLIELTSPIAGIIIEQNVTPAAGVKSPDNAPNLFTIADLSHVWVLCDVYENDLSKAKVREEARIELSAYPGRSFLGRIGNVSQVLDPNTRTAKVRIELENTDRVLRPGMFAVASLQSRSPETRMALPATAIVQLHDAAWVFVKVGPGSFRRALVTTGGELETGVETILSGIVPGERVVRNALQFAQTISGQ